MAVEHGLRTGVSQETAQPAEAALKVSGQISHRLQHQSRMMSHIWKRKPPSAPNTMPATAIRLVRLSVDMPDNPWPTVQPIAVTPPMPISTAPPSAKPCLRVAKAFPAKTAREQEYTHEPNTTPATDATPTVRTLEASLKK